VLHRHDNGVSPVASSGGHASAFVGRSERRVVPHVGHNIPQEAPASSPKRCRRWS